MDRLSAIKAPVWLIWGENDTLLPKSHLSIWLKGLSGARARGYLIPGAGHSPHVERPFVTAALLTQILFGREPHNLGARWWKLARQEG